MKQHHLNKVYNGKIILGFLIAAIRRGSDRRVFTIWITNILLFTLLASFSLGQELPIDLTELSLEDLMNIEVTSVSKKIEKLSHAAAAIYVVTGEDIRSSGSTSIADALRMVPGMQVARIDANKWAITSRGFNDNFANKLLVLIDGRSVYTPLSSGVYWDVQDVLIEDIERIEVIRGPGATLWGANAVNGVINIITKNSKNTQGGFMQAGGGSEEKGFGSFRYGSKLGNDAFFRVYGKGFNRDNSVDSSGAAASDDWNILRAGFRVDWEKSNSNTFTLQGDIYDGEAGVTYNFPVITPPYNEVIEDKTQISGGNVLVRWTHLFSRHSDITMKLYFDRTKRHDVFYGENRNIVDFDFQHRFEPFKRLELIWGTGYRYTVDDILYSDWAWGDPEREDNKDNLFSAFIQGDIALSEDLLRLTVGSKFEHNEYTGFEFQPNIRIRWFPYNRQTLWAAVSRAVRTPSCMEHVARITMAVIPPGTTDNPTPYPVKLVCYGDNKFESEDLIAYEAGYRIQPTDRISTDIAAFYNVYDNLRSLTIGNPIPDRIPPTYLYMEIPSRNNMDGETYGVELAVNWQTQDWLHLKAVYTYLQMRMSEEKTDIVIIAAEDKNPHNQLFLRTAVNLYKDVKFDLGVRYVDNLPQINIGSYVTFDARICWILYNKLELSVIGQNLAQHRHSEFISPLHNINTQAERSAYGAITWRF